MSDLWVGNTDYADVLVVRLWECHS